MNNPPLLVPLKQYAIVKVFIIHIFSYQLHHMDYFFATTNTQTHWVGYWNQSGLPPKKHKFEGSKNLTN